MNFLNIFRGTGKILTKPNTIQQAPKPMDSFTKWASHHREHQKNAIQALTNNTIGQCSILEFIDMMTCDEAHTLAKVFISF